MSAELLPLHEIPAINEFRASDKILDLIPAIRDSVMSPRSKKIYTQSLRDFILWNQGHELERTRVLEYRQHLLDQGKAPATVNLCLTAIRRLAEEAEAQGWLGDRVARQILAIPGIPNRGVKFGNWLSEEQALAILTVPDQRTNKGKRDFIMLGLLLGCGLRSDEARRLQVEQVAERDGRLVLLDILGKGQKFRTVAVPRWMEGALREWMALCGGTGPAVRQVLAPGDRLRAEGMNNWALTKHVIECAAAIGVKLSPHDLRRTHAALATLNGANIESVRQALGHESLATTTRYVAGALSLKNPACDFVFGGAK